MIFHHKFPLYFVVPMRFSFCTFLFLISLFSIPLTLFISSSPFHVQSLLSLVIALLIGTDGCLDI